MRRTEPTPASSGIFGDDPPDAFDAERPNRWAPTFDAIARVFRHEVRGLEHIPRQGPALLVLNHGPYPVDAVLLCRALHRDVGRWPRFLGEKLIFERPAVGERLARWGVVEGTPYQARRRFLAGDLVGVFPGGSREAWKPHTQRRQLLWEGRDGFARVAFKSNVPIIPVASPAADDLVWVLNDAMGWGERVLGARRRLPLPVVLGLGLLPFPVKLVHVIGSPIVPERRAGETSEDAVQRIKRDTQAALEALLTG